MSEKIITILLEKNKETQVFEIYGINKKKEKSLIKTLNKDYIKSLKKAEAYAKENSILLSKNHFQYRTKKGGEGISSKVNKHSNTLLDHSFILSPKTDAQKFAMKIDHNRYLFERLMKFKPPVKEFINKGGKLIVGGINELVTKEQYLELVRLKNEEYVPAEFIGEVGKETNGFLKLNEISTVDNKNNIFYTIVILTFTDINGNIVTFSTKDSGKLKVGEWYNCTYTIKEHVEYVNKKIKKFKYKSNKATLKRGSNFRQVKVDVA